MQATIFKSSEDLFETLQADYGEFIDVRQGGDATKQKYVVAHKIEEGLPESVINIANYVLATKVLANIEVMAVLGDTGIENDGSKLYDLVRFQDGWLKLAKKAEDGFCSDDIEGSIIIGTEEFKDFLEEGTDLNLKDVLVLPSMPDDVKLITTRHNLFIELGEIRYEQAGDILKMFFEVGVGVNDPENVYKNTLHDYNITR